MVALAGIATTVAVVARSMRTAAGMLVVKVDQSGATLVVDDDEDHVRRAVAGETTEIQLTPGRHELRINKDGFLVETRRFEIVGGDTISLSVDLRQEAPVEAEIAARRRPFGGRGLTSRTVIPSRLDDTPPRVPSETDGVTRAPDDRPPSQPQPRDTASLRLLVDDRFTSPSGFGEWNNDQLSAAYVANASQFQITAKQAGVWSPPPRPWRTDTDFVCEVEGRLARPAAGAWGLVFGYQDSIRTFFGAYVRHDARAGLQHAFYENLVPWSAVPSIKTITDTNKLRVEVAGRRATLFVNDTFVGEADDERFQRGEVGPMVRCEVPPLDARFERFRVWVDEPARMAPVLSDAPRPRNTDAMTLLLDDQFRNPKSGWDAWNVGGSQTEYLDGEFQFLLKAPSKTWWAGPLRTVVGEFVCEMEGRLEGPARGAWGVAFGIRHMHDWIAAMVRDDGRIALGRQTRVTEYLPWTSGEPVRPAGEFNTLRIEVAGSSVRLFFNGRFVDAVDLVDCDGAFALLVAGAEGGLDARFRRIRVWAQTPITPCDTSAMKLLVDDDFHDPKSGFVTIDDEDLLAGYLGSEYRMQTKHNDTRMAGFPAVDGVVRDSVDDFVCEVQGRVAQHDDGGWGLAFGVHDGDGFNANVRGRSASLGWAHYNDILAWHNERAVAAPTEPSTLRIEVVGQGLRMFIDGVHVGDTTDARYRGGMLALLAHGFGGPVDARFQRIRLWVPSPVEKKATETAPDTGNE
jgi:hypothetical protein